MSPEELIKELDRISFSCHERLITFVGCLGCEYRSNGTGCLLNLKGTPDEWKIKRNREEEEE